MINVNSSLGELNSPILLIRFEIVALSIFIKKALSIFELKLKLDLHDWRSRDIATALYLVMILVLISFFSTQQMITRVPSRVSLHY